MSMPGDHYQMDLHVLQGERMGKISVMSDCEWENFNSFIATVWHLREFNLMLRIGGFLCFAGTYFYDLAKLNFCDS